MTDPAPLPAPFEMGPYTLLRPLARGAMGQVWEARHTKTGIKLAVKCLKDTEDDWAKAAFRTEVRATASLEHVGIVAVYDEGRVTEAAAAASNGLLEGGRPYLVMELVAGEPLQGRVGRLAWPVLQDVLLQLMDALAHSHARGVVHRDLKPGNILVTEDPVSGVLRVRISDFGLAQARDHVAGHEEAVAGTPAYMAPEQLQGDWRDQGPWTDLYSLGCLAWALATGAPPFGRGREFVDFRHDHLYRPPPAFCPCVAVPAAFEQWLRRLLCKDPVERFSRAADAAIALRTLDERQMLSAVAEPDQWRAMLAGSAEVQSDGETGKPRGEDVPPMPDVSTRVLEAAARQERLPETPLYPEPRFPPLAKTRARVPDHWRRRSAPENSSLPGVGLELLSLRTMSMVGRTKARDTLWMALRDVERSGRPRCVVLRGPSGTGKSRLAEWICERGAETAGVNSLRSYHAENEGPETGLAPMVARHLRCWGMPRAQLVERVDRLVSDFSVVGDDEKAALVQFIQPDVEDEQAASPVVQFQDARERYVLLERILSRIDGGVLENGGPRTSVVWLDDVQWGSDALAFAQHVLSLEHEESLPVLLVLTVQEAALMTRPSEAAALRALVQGPETEEIQVGPLPSADHAELVEILLGGRGALHSKVCTRTAGSPLFAVQLVSDWVSRGLLVQDGDGVALRPEAHVSLPDDLHEVWQGRVDRILEGFGSLEARALELAAVLGNRVDRREWDAVCMRVGQAPDFRFLDRLVALRLASVERGGAGWRFAHPMLRSCLLRRALEEQRLREHHRVCADAFVAWEGTDRPSARRTAHHLLSAGAHREAAPMLLLAAEHSVRGGDWAETRRTLVRRVDAMNAADIAPADPSWAAGRSIWLRCLRMVGRFDEAMELLSEWQAAAEQHGWRESQAELTLEHARVAHHRGDVAEAGELVGAALQASSSLQQNRLLVLGLQLRARLLIEQGELEEAAASLREALGVVEASDAERADAWLLLGRVAKQQGRLAEAEQLFSEALRVFEQAGNRWGVASSMNESGEVARLRGDLELAAERYRESLHRMSELGAENVHIVRINLAIVLLQQGQTEGIAEYVGQALVAFEHTGQRAMIGTAHLLLSSTAAATRDWCSWDIHFQRGRSLVRETRFIEQDIALIATAAGDIAAEAGWVDRASAAWRLAREQWEVLERPDALREIDARLHPVGPA